MTTNWLPENVTLNLTMLEAGWLQAQLDALKVRADAEHIWKVCKPGPKGEVIATTFPERIGEKLMRAVFPE